MRQIIIIDNFKKIIREDEDNLLYLFILMLKFKFKCTIKLKE